MLAQTTRHCQCLPRHCRHLLSTTTTCTQSAQERPPPLHSFRHHSVRAHGYRERSAAGSLSPTPPTQKPRELKGPPRRRCSSKTGSGPRAGREHHHPQNAPRSRRGLAGHSQTKVPRDAGLQRLLVQEMRSSPTPFYRGPRDRYGLFEALQLGTPRHLVHVLAAASQDREFMRGLPRTLWSETLRFMAPKRWLPRASRSHGLFFNPDSESDHDIGSTTASAGELLNAISETVRVRRQVGISMDLVDYKILMSHARDLANPRMARSVIEDMRLDGFDPDIDCWNYYALALLHNEQQQTGLLRWNYNSALKIRSPGPPRIYKDGMLMSVRSVYEGIRHEPGISFDTTTYCIYMTALARDGEFEAVSEILRSTWGLDPSEPDADIPTEKVHAQGDVLYPTHRLLETIAEVYGSNEELSVALKLIDKLSQHYGLPMEVTMWRSLLLWTWVHARRKQQVLRERNRDTARRVAEETQSRFFKPASVTQTHTENPGDQLQAFDALFEAMSTNNPAFAMNMNLMHLRFYNQLGLRATGKDSLTDPIRKGREIHSKLLREQASASRLSEEILRQGRSDADSNSGDIPGLKGGAAVATYLAQAQLDVRISRRYLLNWTKRVIETGVPDSYVDNASEQEQAQIHGWMLCGIPDLVAQSLTFLPLSVRYQVPSGIVNLNLGPMGQRKLALRAVRELGTDDDIAEQEVDSESVGNWASG